MEETKTSGLNQDQVSDDLNVNDVNEKTEDVVSYSSHRKLLGEKKRIQAEKADLEEKIKLYEQNKAAAEGRKEDVIKSLREENETFKSQLVNTQKTYALNVLSGQIKAEAVKQGCINAEKLLRLMPDEDLKGIDIDDDFQINSDDLKRVIAKAKAENSDIGLFNSRTVNVNDLNSPNMPKAKGIKEMTKQELEALALAKLS